MVKTYAALIASMVLLIAASGVALCNVVINEMELNPPQNDPQATEWVELYNPGPDDVNVSGWWVSIISTPENKAEFSWSGKMNIGSEITLLADDYLVLYGDPKWVHGPNATAVLYDATGSEVDRTPMRMDNKSDGSDWSRFPNGYNSWAYIPSTKGSVNVISAMS